MPWFRDVYADAVRDAKYALRPNEKLVALIYAEHAGDPDKPNNDLAWVSWPRLSEQTGIRSKDALNRAVRHLVKRGWLVLAEPGKQHRSPRYRLVIPEAPEVRAAYVWDGSEVREEDLSQPDGLGPAVRETDAWPVENPPSGTPDEPLSSTAHGPVNSPGVRETTPGVRETTTSGTPDGPDPSTDPSTTDISITKTQPQTARAKPKCEHQWTADHYCRFCDRHEPCPDCRRLARISDTIRCYQHQDHQEAS